MSTGNSTLQLGAAPNMRGRVMSLWFVAFQGSTPIGGPIIGWVMATAGARAGLGVGAITCLLVAALGLMAVRRGMERREHEAPEASRGRSLAGEPHSNGSDRRGLRESGDYPGGMPRYGSAKDMICPKAGAATVPP